MLCPFSIHQNKPCFVLLFFLFFCLFVLFCFVLFFHARESENTRREGNARRTRLQITSFSCHRVVIYKPSPKHRAWVYYGGKRMENAVYR